MKSADTVFTVLTGRKLGLTALWFVAGGLLTVLLPATASSPTGHIIISEQVMNKILNDPNANPELKALLRDPDARKAFSGGACAPDLDSLAEQAHTSSPQAVADSIMGTARANLAKAQKALNAATSPEQVANAEKVMRQAKCDIAFAYGWRCHAAADFETHPFVNSDGKNYWDDETRNRFQEQKDQATHGEWEVMQEALWIEKYGKPKDPNVDYRLGLLEKALGFEHNDLLEDVKTLSNKEYASAYVGDKYTKEQLDFWKSINGPIGDRSIDRTLDFVKTLNNPLDGSCWDVAWGIPVEDFRKFIEDTKKGNGGFLPDNFWMVYENLFNKWKNSQGGGTAGGGTTGGSLIGTGLPPPISNSSGQSGRGAGGQPSRPVSLKPFR